MSRFKCAQLVQWEPSLSGGVDDLGNDVEGFDVLRELMVFAWFVGKSADVDANGHLSRVDSDGTLYALAESGVNHGDRFHLPGHPEAFTVDGIPANYDANPWWSPGLIVVNLRQVTG